MTPMTSSVRNLPTSDASNATKSPARTIIGLVALVIALGAAVILFATQSLQQHTSDLLTAHSDKQATELLSMHIATAVNYNQLEPVQGLLTELGEASGSSLASAVVLDQDRKAIIQYDNPRMKKFSWDQVEGTLKSAPSASAVEKLANYEVVVTPIRMGADQRHIGTFAVAWDRTAMKAAVRGDAVINAVVIVIVCFAILFALFFLLTKMVTGPIQQITQTMRRLAAGDNTVEVGLQNRKDEIGQIAEAVQIFKRDAIAKAELESSQAAENQQRQKRAERLVQLCADFERKVEEVIGKFMQSTSSLQAASSELGNVAAQTTSQSTIVANASRAATTNVEATAVAVEAMAADAQDFARQIQTSQDISRKAVAEARSVNTKVETLSGAVQQVDEVVRLISNIAAQTNLLALNATIEAARAGEAGRGFAIVASEVKNLAQQTGAATVQIGQQIGDMRRAMDDAVGSVQAISDVIVQIENVSEQISAVVSNQTATTSGIVGNVQQAAAGTSKVTESIENVARLTAQTDKAVGLVSHSSQEVCDQSTVLQREVVDFLARIQAA